MRILSTLAAATVLVAGSTYAASASIAASIAASSAASTGGSASTTKAGKAGTITTTVSDADDTPGPLDIASVRHRVRQRSDGTVRVAYRIRTFDGFAVRRLHRRHRNVVIELHRTRERGADRNITIMRRDGRLVAALISNATRRVIRDLHVAHPDSRTLRVSGSRQAIGARSVFVTSSFHARGSRRCGFDGGYPVTCQDDVPQHGWLALPRSAWP